MLETLQVSVWQDFVFMIGGFILAALLIPTVMNSDSQVPLTTTIPTIVILLLYIVTFASLDMWLSAAAQFFGVIMWVLIALYRSPHEHRRSTPW